MDERICDRLYFAYYGKLLSERQQKALKLRFDCDMSLSEAAQELGVTRQGVMDAVRRAMKKLRETESKVRLIERIMRVVRDLESYMRKRDLTDADRAELIGIVDAVRDADGAVRDIERED